MENNPMVVIETVKWKNEKFQATSSTRDEQETDWVINYNKAHRIPVNRSVLVQRCPFFTRMTQHGFKEASSENIDVNYNANVHIFKQLLNYIHTAKIELSTDNVDTIVGAAIYFQLDDLLKFSCNVIKRNISIENVHGIHTLAMEKSLDAVRKAVIDYDVENFEEIAENDLFLVWTFDHMFDIVCSDDVVVSHEIKVVRFVFSWLDYDLSRSNLADPLFHNLRFSHITTDDMRGIAKTKSRFINFFTEVSKLFADQKTRPRVYHIGIYLLAVVGRYRRCVFLHYWPADGSISFFQSPDAPDVTDDKTRTVIVESNEVIYMLQYLREVSGTGVSNCIEMKKFYVKKRTWSSGTPIELENNQVCHFAACYLQKKILVFLSLADSTCVRLTYCINTDTWESSSLNVPELEHGFPITSATTYGDDCIYVDMGKNLVQYKPFTGSWIVYPCQENLKYRQAVMYKTKILFFGDHSDGYETLVVYDVNVQEFQYFPLVDFDSKHLHDDSKLSFQVFNQSLYVFDVKYCLVMEFDLSFIELNEEQPTNLYWSYWNANDLTNIVGAVCVQ